MRTVIRHHKVGWTDSCGQRPARGARILLDVRLVSTSLDSKRAWCFSPNGRNDAEAVREATRPGFMLHATIKMHFFDVLTLSNFRRDLECTPRSHRLRTGFVGAVSRFLAVAAEEIWSRQNLRHHEYGPAGSSAPGLSAGLSKAALRSSASSSTKTAITKLTVASSSKRRFGAVASDDQDDAGIVAAG